MAVQRATVACRDAIERIRECRTTDEVREVLRRVSAAIGDPDVDRVAAVLLAEGLARGPESEEACAFREHCDSHAILAELERCVDARVARDVPPP